MTRAHAVQCANLRTVACVRASFDGSDRNYFFPRVIAHARKSIWLAFCGAVEDSLSRTKRKYPVFTATLMLIVLAPLSRADSVHTPASGSAEREGILAALHAEYTTGSGSSAKFKVNYCKVHNGWAWINVVPLNPAGEIEGEEWPSLLQEKDGKWLIIDLIKIASNLDDPVGPMDPSPKFLREVQKRYPGVPSDIFPKTGSPAKK
jgi:hypothetical protein